MAASPENNSTDSPLAGSRRWPPSWSVGLTWEQLTQRSLKWFAVDDDKVADILQKIRAELPTTEAWLIGKPQREQA